MHLLPIGTLRVAVTVAALLATVGPTKAEDFEIGQKGKAFSVARLTIKRGDQIVFLNDDSATHNVYSETEGASFDLGAQKPGESKAITLNRLGVIEVGCQIHPKMSLIIVVK